MKALLDFRKKQNEDWLSEIEAYKNKYREDLSATLLQLFEDGSVFYMVFISDGLFKVSYRNITGEDSSPSHREESKRMFILSKKDLPPEIDSFRKRWFQFCREFNLEIEVKTISWKEYSNKDIPVIKKIKAGRGARPVELEITSLYDRYRSLQRMEAVPLETVAVSIKPEEDGYVVLFEPTNIRVSGATEQLALVATHKELDRIREEFLLKPEL